jgi:type IV pilus assembly protein PilM
MGLQAITKLPAVAKLYEQLTSSVGGTVGLTPSIAIDFGVSGLKILQLEMGDQPKLVAASFLQTPEELLLDHGKRLEFQIQNLGKLVRQGGFKGKRAVCTIPAWLTAVKTLQIPKSEMNDLGGAVKGAIPAQLGVAVEAIVYRCFDTGVASNGIHDILLLAAAREQIGRIVKGLTDAKLVPVGMQSEYTAILRAFDHLNRRSGDTELSTLYIDLGAGSTKVLIGRGHELLFARLIDIGGRHLDQLAAKQLQCSIAEARRLRHISEMASNGGNPVPWNSGSAGVERRTGATAKGLSDNLLQQPSQSTGPEATNLSEPIEILTDEIMMSVRYYTSQSSGRKIDRVMFVGGEALCKGACQMIAKALRTTAHAADPFSWVIKQGNEPTLGIDVRQTQPGWAAVMGLCVSPTDL